MSSHEELVLVAKLGRTHALNGAMKLHNLSDFYEQFRPGAKFFLRERSGLKELEVEHFDAENSIVKFKNISSITAAKTLVNAQLFSTKARSKAEFTLAENEYFYFDIIGLDVVENGQRLGKICEIIDQGANYLFEVQTDEELAARYEAAATAEMPAEESVHQGAVDVPAAQAGGEVARAAKNAEDIALSGAGGKQPLSKRAAKRAALAKKKAASKPKGLPKRFYVPYVDAYIAAVELSAGRVLTHGALAILLNS